MKITIFIGSLFGGGAERVACNLANYLSENQHEISIITMSETQNSYELYKEVKVLPLLNLSEHTNKLKGIIFRYFRLKNLLKSSCSDCYIVFLPRTTSLLLHFKKIIKSSVIASERCDPYVYPTKTQRLLKKYAPRADAWVFQTADSAKWYEGLAKKQKIISNAINPAFIREPYYGEKEKSIAAVGRLTEQKNFKLLIGAFSKISFEFPEYKLKIFGKGPLEDELRAYAKEKGIDSQVEFMGHVDNMPEQLEKMRMYVLSSDYEGMPNALMEAMALGLPCVSTDCGGGGARFLIQNEENGLLIPKGDEIAMAEAMKRILSDKEWADKLGNTARKLQETLAPEKIYGEWEKFIKEVVNENGK